MLTSDDPEILGKEVILNSIFKAITNFWNEERMPIKLKEVILPPFIKDTNEDEHDPNNYRTISLMNTILKIYEGIIHKRLVKFLEGKQWFSNFQAAYRKSRSTVDHIFVLQELFLEYRINKNTKNGTQRSYLYVSGLWI